MTPERTTADGRYVLGRGEKDYYVAAWNGGDPRGWRWECSIRHRADFAEVYDRRFPIVVKGGAAMSALADLRTWPGRYPTAATYYCPACDCRKSGDVRDPNRRDEGCQDEECRCHTRGMTP